MTVHTQGKKLFERECDQNLLDLQSFNDVVVGAYNRGVGETELPADAGVARSLVPPGTGLLRDFSYIAPEIPEFMPESCTGCMECVTECPDTAILGKVVREEVLEQALAGADDVEMLRRDWAKTKKYWDGYEKKGKEPGLFGIYIDPTKCKGCAECVTVCGHRGALKMIKKEMGTLETFRRKIEFYRAIPETSREFISDKVLADLMLAERSMLYVGGAGSCMGCGEATALRMMLAATGFVYGPESIGIVASTGCNTVYGSTYPYNPYLVPWTNSLFENGPADALGVRMRWNQMGWSEKKLWVIGGDGAMLDIGFQSLSRMLATGEDINVLVLDTQVYSNTGGQASTSSFVGQNTKFSMHGRAVKGKTERRKELGQICMMHPDVYVAQTTPAHINHFYRAILDANEYDGPAVINVYTTCQPEHGVADDVSGDQAKLAVESRAFPLFVYDPRKGESIKERLSLKGNPRTKEDWDHDRRQNREITFVDFARSEGRFAKHFDADGNPSPEILAAQEDRLKNWRLLQELAGLR